MSRAFYEDAGRRLGPKPKGPLRSSQMFMEAKIVKPALSRTIAGRDRLMMPENCEENNDRDWDAKKPKQHASTIAHVTLRVSSIDNLLPEKKFH
jgi:hypothetical protein